MTYLTRETSPHDGQPEELYRFVQGTSRWLYTSAQAPVDYLSETYRPAAIERGTLEQATELSRGSLEVRIPRDLPLAQLFIAAPPEGTASSSPIGRDGSPAAGCPAPPWPCNASPSPPA
jgi:hypothetical protein